MKRIIIILAFLICGISSAQQYFFNGTVYVPKTTVQINAIVSPPEGRVEANSDTGSLWYFDGTIWKDSGNPLIDASGFSGNLTTSVVDLQLLAEAVDSLTISGGATQLSDLSDVNTSTPTNRNVLVADGTDWQSRSLTEADISDFGGYVDKVLPIVTPATTTVTEKNQHLVGLTIDSTPIIRKQTHYWNGSGYVATSGLGFGDSAMQNNEGAISNGFGHFALRDNTGSGSNGFGNYALANNTGESSSGFGSYALQNNTGGTSNGFGYSALLNNTGNNSNGFGYFALQNNTGNNSNGFGDAALRYNEGSSNNVFGYQSFASFYDNAGDAKAVADNGTDIDTADDQITITSHGFGANGAIVNVRYNSDGTLIAGLQNNVVYQVEIINANTFEFRTNSISSTGSTATHTFTPQFTYSDVNILGSSLDPIRSDQTILGGTAAVMPNSTIAAIDADGSKALITKEYADANYSGGGSSPPFPDNAPIIEDNVDDTKTITIDASNITTGTNRTITMPDADVDLQTVDYITLSNPLDLDGLVITVNSKEDLLNKVTDLSTPDNTQYPTTLAVSNELADRPTSLGTGRTSPIQYTDIFGQTQVDFDTDGAGSAGDLIFIIDAAPADTFTGTEIPLNGFNQKDDTTTDTATWTLATPNRGAVTEILINISTEPAPFSTDTGVTQIPGTTDFAPNTLQLLTVKVILGTVYYFYTTL